MQPQRTSRRQSSVPAARSARADFVDYQRTRDPFKRDRLVEANVDLAYSLAWNYAGRGVEIDDLKQVALVALVRAVECFDPSRGVTFSTYATPTIVGCLKRHFRDRSWAVRPPRRLQERFLAVIAAREHLVGELRRAPTLREIAEYGGWSEQEVRDALAVRDRRTTSDLHAVLEHAGNQLGRIDISLDRVENRELLEDLMQELGARERKIVALRYFDELSQSAIGERVGISQMQVCRLLRTSLESLRAAAADRSLSPN